MSSSDGTYAAPKVLTTTAPVALTDEELGALDRNYFPALIPEQNRVMLGLRERLRLAEERVAALQAHLNQQSQMGG